MQYATEIGPDGKRRVIDAHGRPLGNDDADRPLLHVLPKLLVPTEAIVGKDKLTCAQVELEIKTSLLGSIIPDGGIVIRQPYPNRRYFVGGCTMIRNGWLVPLPLEQTEFVLKFIWRCAGPKRLLQGDRWEVRHLIHVKLQPGSGITYSMDAASWPAREVAAIHLSPTSRLGLSGHEAYPEARTIIRQGKLSDEAGSPPYGHFVEEAVNIVGIPLAQAWTIDAFQDEQAHEIRQVVTFDHSNEAHRRNAVVEMPPRVLMDAITLALKIPFGKGSKFDPGAGGTPEDHPAMQLLSTWWKAVCPDGQPYGAGSAMPLVRVQDDGQYWWGDHEVPQTAIERFGFGAENTARIGDLMLVLFHARQETATYKADAGVMTTYLPSGAPFNDVAMLPEQFEKRQYDEAWFCLRALTAFPSRFPAAWRYLMKAAES